jgi:hypothetical protein
VHRDANSCRCDEDVRGRLQDKRNNKRCMDNEVRLVVTVKKTIWYWLAIASLVIQCRPLARAMSNKTVITINVAGDVRNIKLSELIGDVLEMRTGNRAGDQEGLSGDRL